jgi:subtilisin family serine protease
MHYPRIKASLLTLSVLALSTAASAQNSQHNGFIVRFKSAESAARSVPLSIQSGSNTTRVLTRSGDTLWVKNLNSVQNSPEIDLIEPNYLVSMHFGKLRPKPPTPNPVNGNTWGLKKIQADITLANGARGAGILVAVIDSGVDGTHPELVGRVDQGYDFAADRPLVVDDNGHGTHVAGTIAGKTVGVAPDARILPVKFLNAEGYGYVADAIRGIDFARAKGAQVMNHSWGGSLYSQALNDSVQAARADGIIFIAAAGNSSMNNDNNPQFPANIPGVIAIAATDGSDHLAYFSNFGPRTVPFSAPGVAIYSSIPGGRFKEMSGTSMASPHFAGVVTAVLGKKRMSETALRNCLAQSGDPGSDGYVPQNGRINAKKAVENCTK